VAESESEDRVFDASARKLQQARERGDVPVSREGSAAGIYLAASVAIVLLAGTTARRIGEILLPLIDLPDELTDPRSMACSRPLLRCSRRSVLQSCRSLDC
jgi:flagellar biosynthetic protein FlhB